MKKLIISMTVICLISPNIFAGEDEMSAQIGPDKGITEKKGEQFKLSPEATKTMELEFKDYSGGSFTLDRKAIVFSKGEKDIFKVHEGWYERVPVKVISRSENTYTLTSASLVVGDKIVISGVGFLRIAEISSEQGEGHD